MTSTNQHHQAPPQPPVQPHTPQPPALAKVLENADIHYDVYGQAYANFLFTNGAHLQIRESGGTFTIDHADGHTQHEGRIVKQTWQETLKVFASFVSSADEHTQTITQFEQTDQQTCFTFANGLYAEIQKPNEYTFYTYLNEYEFHETTPDFTNIMIYLSGELYDADKAVEQQPEYKFRVLYEDLQSECASLHKSYQQQYAALQRLFSESEVALRKAKRELHIRRVLSEAPLRVYEPARRRTDSEIVVKHNNRVILNLINHHVTMLAASRTIASGTQVKKQDVYRDMADAIGCGQSVLQQYACRFYAPSYAFAKRVADFFGVTILDVWKEINNYVYDESNGAWYYKDEDGEHIELE